jgi:hypothetical protein
LVTLLSNRFRAPSKRNPGANPTIVSYNASNSISRFLNKKVIFPFFKNALVYYRAGVAGSRLECFLKKGKILLVKNGLSYLFIAL